MTNPKGAERRRSARVRLAIPVEVEWTGEDQVPVREHAETEVLNAYGGLLRMKPRFPMPLHIDWNGQAHACASPPLRTRRLGHWL